jgi:4-oxalocrotonate tautomerase
VTAVPLVTVTMLHGRSPEQKRRLIADLTAVMVEVAGVRHEQVEVVLQEVTGDSWGRGGVPLSEADAGPTVPGGTGQQAAGVPPTRS